MRRRVLCSVAGLTVLWAGLWWFDSRGDQPHRPNSPEPAVPEKHYVTPRQLAASGAMSNLVVVPFSALAHDGRRLSLAELSGGRPLVLVFIKRDCPCSVEFE